MAIQVSSSGPEVPCVPYDPRNDQMKTGATFSMCRTYRYSLWRTWDESRPYALFIGLNPSTADESKDDPTIRRCIGFARSWGFGGLCVVNLFAYRATEPKDMMKAEDPIGPENDRWIKRLSADAGVIVAAWGNSGSFLGSSRTITQKIPNLTCFKLNKSGEPAHPLYQPATATPKRIIGFVNSYSLTSPLPREIEV